MRYHGAGIALAFEVVSVVADEQAQTPAGPEPLPATRPATKDDAAFLEELFRSVHAGEFSAAHLPHAQVDSLLGMQFRGQRMSYAKDFPQAENRIVLDETTQTPVGRILVESRPDAIHLIDVALLPEARGKGTGRRLIAGLLARSRATGIPVTLMVRPDNPAFNLYSQMKFQVTSAGMQIGMEFRPGSEGKLPGREEAAGEKAAPPDGEEWDAVVGQDHRVAQNGTELVTLRLADISRPRKGTFALLFEGPLEPMLAQSIYELTSTQGTDAEAQILFIVPIGPRNGYMQYEAVFNRL